MKSPAEPQSIRVEVSDDGLIVKGDLPDLDRVATLTFADAPTKGPAWALVGCLVCAAICMFFFTAAQLFPEAYWMPWGVLMWMCSGLGVLVFAYFGGPRNSKSKVVYLRSSGADTFVAMTQSKAANN